MNQQWRTVGMHLLGWSLFLGLVIGFMISAESFSARRFSESLFLLFVAVYTAVFYLNTDLLMPKLFFRRKFALYFLCIALLFTAVYALRPYDRLLKANSPRGRHERPTHFRPPPPNRPFPPRGPGPQDRPVRYDIVSLVLFLAVWSSGTALQVSRRWRQTERRALQAERDKTTAELSFLKAQVNPHFLFNTLNNIYSLSIVRSEETPQAILKLSEILHYITDDVRNDFVPLQSELDCVQNYIALQQMRLTDKVDLSFSLNGIVEGRQIAPLLFLTFIENAFKYGISSHEPCRIEITITVEEKTIHFFCRNQVMVKNATEERTGIGINDARKRLDYLYPQKHSLFVDTKDGDFTVDLKIWE